MPVAFSEITGQTRASVEPRRRLFRVPVHIVLGGTNSYALDLRELVVGLPAALAAHPGVLHPPPGRGGVEPVVVVDPHHPGLDPTGYPVRAGYVAGPNG